MLGGVDHYWMIRANFSKRKKYEQSVQSLDGLSEIIRHGDSSNK